MTHAVFASSSNADNWSIWILLISAAWVVVSIAKFKLHPFLSLMSAAILVGLLTGPLPETTPENKGLFHERVDLNPSENQEIDLKLAIKWSLLGFGNTTGGIGLLIALAAIVGTCMMKSGAAERIVRFLLSIFGPQRAGLVLLVSGFLLSIPVFFDTVFFLLIPLARAMAIRLGGRYLYFVIAMAGAGAITHSMVPPTPGPLLIAEFLKLDLGVAIFSGLLASIPIAILVLWVAGYFNGKYDFPMREVAGIKNEELRRTMNQNDDELPSLFISSLPILLPIFLVSGLSLSKLIIGAPPLLEIQESVVSSDIFKVLSFAGEPNVAMSLAAFFSYLGYAKQKHKSSLKKFLEAPLLTAGSIILITGAGGAYGGMIRLSGVGELIANHAIDLNLSFVVLAWAITAFIRIAQGSATVAMITGASLVAAMVGDGADLAYHPLYLYLAIGFGSITLSWMNDSGFWVVQKLSGLTEAETLKTWTVTLTLISLAGLAICWLGSLLLPLR